MPAALEDHPDKRESYFPTNLKYGSGKPMVAKQAKEDIERKPSGKAADEESRRKTDKRGEATSKTDNLALEDRPEKASYFPMNLKYGTGKLTVASQAKEDVAIKPSGEVADGESRRKAARREEAASETGDSEQPTPSPDYEDR